MPTHSEHSPIMHAREASLEPRGSLFAQSSVSTAPPTLAAAAAAICSLASRAREAESSGSLGRSSHVSLLSLEYVRR